MQIEPLPPLNTLIAFECVARYGNISRAAEELNLTQSATSRQILQLEEMLGCKLFTRTQRRVLLTPRGEAYAARVRQQLAALSHATAEVMGWTGLPQVTIACTSAMSSLWLSSRLSALHRELPDLQVRMKITDNFSELRSSEFDLAIFTCGMFRWAFTPRRSSTRSAIRCARRRFCRTSGLTLPQKPCCSIRC